MQQGKHNLRMARLNLVGAALNVLGRTVSQSHAERGSHPDDGKRACKDTFRHEGMSLVDGEEKEAEGQTVRVA
ncbi:hypothetical protein AA0312_2273 [Acetobacter tropicalis NRIC 0312]|uniref:Transposase n=1 Tax=Acetobacter tropicalis TaxID=104102 RepID=A0A511FLG1_9PROT|nr:hypothetical protein ATR1_068c0040 [Acetobacter tropicalis]GBR71353.1 hypothetical protein AA0312_2273 [Acetobacter tropicalis NRIC 0312]GEL50071.1 hypothetical protein ATR01nite_11460 [Acetobacter tropicalis]